MRNKLILSLRTSGERIVGGLSVIKPSTTIPRRGKGNYSSMRADETLIELDHRLTESISIEPAVMLSEEALKNFNSSN